MRSTFGLQQWLQTKSTEGEWRIWARAWAPSRNQLWGRPSLPAPQLTLWGLLSPATHRTTGDSQHNDGQSPRLARELKIRVQSSRMSCQTRLCQTRWEDIPTAGSMGADNAPQRSLTDKSGTKPIHINEETKAFKPDHSLKTADKESEVRKLYCIFKLLSTDHNCSSYFLQFPLPVCSFSNTLQMRARVLQAEHTTWVSPNHSVLKLQR